MKYMKDKSLWLSILIALVIGSTSLKYPIIFLLFVTIIGAYTCNHKFYNKNWLINHKQYFLKKSNNKEQMSNVINKLYDLHTHYLNHMKPCIFQIPKVLHKNEHILLAQCGIKYDYPNSKSTNFPKVILLVTNHRLISVGSTSSTSINLKQIKNLKYTKRIPHIRKSKLVIHYKVKTNNNKLNNFLKKIKHTSTNMEKHNKEVFYLITPNEVKQIRKIINKY